MIDYQDTEDRALLDVHHTLDSDAGLTFSPLYASAQSVPPLVFDADGQPAAGWGDEASVVQVKWADSIHFVVDGVDVSRFRSVFPEFVQWPLLEKPFVYAGARVRFPSIDFLEYRSTTSSMPAGLRWMRKKARATLIVVNDGVKTILWRGLCTKVSEQDRSPVLQFDGDATGVLELDDRQQPLFTRTKDGAIFLWEAFRDHFLTMTPYLGLSTGIELANRGSGESYLDYAAGLLADLVKTDGTSYAVDRAPGDRGYRMVQNDRETIHFTLFAGSQGVNLEGLVSDLAEETNTLYGQGQDPNGAIWLNGITPGLVQGTAPDYPIAAGTPFGEGTTNAAFDDPEDDALDMMIWKLIWTGYLSRVRSPGGYDGDITDAIKRLQRDAHLTVTGDMDPDTWDAMYDKNVTGYSTLGSRILPLAQTDSVRKWDRSPSGELIRRNPTWDSTDVVVARTIAHGTMTQDRATRWSRGELTRSAGDNWAGTIDLDKVDVFAGDHHHGDPDPLVLPRALIRPGMNGVVRGMDGDIVVQVAANTPNDWDSSTLTVDTRARDLPVIGDILERERASRINRGRLWKQQHSTAGLLRTGRIPFWEQCGLIGDPIHLQGGRWNQPFFVVGGDEGQIQKIELWLKTSAFYFALFASKPSIGWLRRHIPNPAAKDSDGNPSWLKPEVQDRLYNQRTLLYAAGTAEEPCGYDPRTHQKADGSGVTDAPVTGRYSVTRTIDYHCFGAPLLWFAVYPLNDAVVRPGRALWQQLASVS